MANVCSNYESVEIEVEAAALRAAVHSLLDENDARKNARAAARGTRLSITIRQKRARD